MTTLIQSGDRNCNAACHYAQFSECRCVCGGLYHGRGRDGTLAETVDRTQEVLMDAWEEAGCDVSELRAAKKGELAERLAAERTARLGRRRRTRTPRMASRTIRGRSASDRQGVFLFAASSANQDALHQNAEDSLYQGISGGPDGSPVVPGETQAGAQDEPQEGEESDRSAEDDRRADRSGELVDEAAGEDGGGEGGSG
jgi:hypothetical protein